MKVLRNRRVARSLGIGVLLALTAGCGAASAPTSSPASSSDELVAAAAPQQQPGTAVDPPAPATYQPVERPGSSTTRSLRAGAGRFSAAAPVRYPDGVAIRVDSVSRDVERSAGPGGFPGRPLSVLALTLTNGSTQPLDLSQVVVTTTYGTRPRTASPVYDHPAAADFAGTVPPGGSTRATYVFAVPPGQARSVEMHVDVDAAHSAAAFTGALQ